MQIPINQPATADEVASDSDADAERMAKLFQQTEREIAAWFELSGWPVGEDARSWFKDALPLSPDPVHEERDENATPD